MSIIAGQKRKKADYAAIPATVSHSDYLQPIDVIVWAYIDCRKSKKDGWPVLSFEEIAKDLHVKKVTVTYAIKRLREAGFLTTTRKTSGNLMVLSDEADKYDTLHGEDVRNWTYVSKKLLTSGITAQHILVLIFLDRRQEKRPTAWASQEAIAKFLGKDIRTVRRIIAKLKDMGLIEPSPLPGSKIYQYALFFRDFGNETEESETTSVVDEPEAEQPVKVEDRVSEVTGEFDIWGSTITTPKDSVVVVEKTPDVEEDMLQYVMGAWYMICGAQVVRPGEDDVRQEIDTLIAKAIAQLGADKVEKILDDYSDACHEAGRRPSIKDIFTLLDSYLTDFDSK
jgi:DNA-binding MarR family transcriptional regulator